MVLGEAAVEGCDDRLVVYCSTQTHSSIEKAVRITGLGTHNLRQIEEYLEATGSGR